MAIIRRERIFQRRTAAVVYFNGCNEKQPGWYVINTEQGFYNPCLCEHELKKMRVIGQDKYILN